MRFSVDHTDLAPALALTARIVPTRSVRPVLSAVFLDARDDHLVLAATDMETTRVCRVAAQVEEPGRVAIPARYLTELLRRIPGGAMDCRSAAGGGLELSWLSSQFSMHGFDVEEYPPIPTFPAAASVRLPQRLLRHALQHTTFAAAQGDTARALLTGVELRFLPEAVFALATDGFQVASYASDPGLARPEDAVVVQASVLQEVARTLGDTDEACEIAEDASQILFRAGGTYMACRLLEGKYFAVLDLVPKQFSTIVHVQRSPLLEATQRVGVVSENDPPFALLLSVSQSVLELSASAADVGEAREELPARVEGPTLQMGFNGRQLAEGLQRFSGQEVVIEISGATTLARFSDPEDGRLQFLQMPLQMPA